MTTRVAREGAASGIDHLIHAGAWRKRDRSGCPGLRSWRAYLVLPLTGPGNARPLPLLRSPAAFPLYVMYYYSTGAHFFPKPRKHQYCTY